MPSKKKADGKIYNKNFKSVNTTQVSAYASKKKQNTCFIMNCLRDFIQLQCFETFLHK